MGKKEAMLGAAGGAALIALLLKQFAMKKQKRSPLAMMPDSQYVQAVASSMSAAKPVAPRVTKPKPKKPG